VTLSLLVEGVGQRRSCGRWDRDLVKEAYPEIYPVDGFTAYPVDYPFRFSGPVTASPPAASGMASNPTSSASPAFASIKKQSSPPLFQQLSPSLLSPHSSPSCTAPPGRASGRTNSTYCLRAPPSSQQHQYDPASGNNAAARPAGSYSLDASAALPRPSDPCVDPCTMTLVKRPAFQQVDGDLVTRRS
jgi:hypothetical protein